MSGRELGLCYDAHLLVVQGCICRSDGKWIEFLFVVVVKLSASFSDSQRPLREKGLHAARRSLSAASFWPRFGGAGGCLASLCGKQPGPDLAHH